VDNSKAADDEYYVVHRCCWSFQHEDSQNTMQAWFQEHHYAEYEIAQCDLRMECHLVLLVRPHNLMIELHLLHQF
jgi:hypothetical protein